MEQPLYRAWDTEEQRMYEVRSLFWSMETGKLQLIGVFSPPDTLILHDPDRYILMQWTGKHDRNRERIYPGDIVRWCGDQYTITFSEDEGTWILKDDRYDWDCPSLYGVSSPQQSRIQIIGNIYQPPRSATGESE
jgi:uncharacterized phage protein (TIGR01671 family)